QAASRRTGRHAADARTRLGAERSRHLLSPAIGDPPVDSTPATRSRLRATGLTMRYVKGCISLSPKQDYPLLRRLLHCGFATHGQLFDFMRAGGHESSRWSFNWRVRRLTAHGLLAQHAVPCIGKAFVYSITPAGALELADAGERFVIAPANTDRDGKELRVAHAIELNNIHLSLLRASFLARWVPEVQIRSRNAAEWFTHAKDYDAIVTVRLGNCDA